MQLIPSLQQRCLRPEIMDEPGLDPQRHQQALRGLARINRWSGSARILWPAIRDLARQLPAARPLRILDIATGGGDVPVKLWHKGQRAGLSLQITGCDRSPEAVAFARRHADRSQAPVHFFEWDACQGDLPGSADVVTCSLFLHHLDEEQAVALFQRMARAAKRAILVNDLVRSWTGLALAYVGTRVLTTSRVVHVDGPRSVANAFTIPEAAELARRAGLGNARIRRRWPRRMLLSWQRPT
jgi:SAM-dependent methyltransferase